MSKKYGESMSAWERKQEESEWRRKCLLAMQKNDREWIESLIEEGMENQYDESMILDLEAKL